MTSVNKTSCLTLGQQRYLSKSKRWGSHGRRGGNNRANGTTSASARDYFLQLLKEKVAVLC